MTERGNALAQSPPPRYKSPRESKENSPYESTPPIRHAPANILSKKDDFSSLKGRNFNPNQGRNFDPCVRLSRPKTRPLCPTKPPSARISPHQLTVEPVRHCGLLYHCPPQAARRKTMDRSGFS